MVSVLTPTISGRKKFREECKASVQAQTYRDFEHLIRLDRKRVGCSKTMNILSGKAKGEWLFILADDDLILPRCLELLVGAAKKHRADIVYHLPLVWGENAVQFHAYPPNITAFSLIRTSLWRDLGGYDENLKETEDRDFYTRAMEVDARFHRFDEHPVAVYRFHGGNKSRL